MTNGSADGDIQRQEMEDRMSFSLKNGVKKNKRDKMGPLPLPLLKLLPIKFPAAAALAMFFSVLLF